MKILVVGSGGREHALCWKLAQNPKVEHILCAPGNGGTAEIGENVEVRMMTSRHLFRLQGSVKLILWWPVRKCLLSLGWKMPFVRRNSLLWSQRLFGQSGRLQGLFQECHG